MQINNEIVNAKTHKINLLKWKKNKYQMVVVFFSSSLLHLWPVFIRNETHSDANRSQIHKQSVRTTHATI